MSDDAAVKPYLKRIKKWKIRNMIMLYLEGRDRFKKYNRMVKRGTFLSFAKLRELCDILYEAKEEHHQLYKRLQDPRKSRFEKANKFVPDEIELEFMNNIGLLFHKLLVARELKYVIEHYVEESETFQKNSENLKNQLELIDVLFDEGIKILESLITRNTDNVLLLTLLLENPEMTKRHFGKNAVQLVEHFGSGTGLDDLYFSVGQYYVACGREEKAKKMFKSALKNNAKHKLARQQLSDLS
ncbi:MAG: hypothetical protein ACE5IY_00050 [bacterium]